jgi:iron complex outermembrane receptor protein
MQVCLLPRTLFLCLACQIGFCAQAAPADSQNLADLSFEELANLEITSVSKRAQRLSDAAASIFVITSEDIRRSGATSLAEALRLAPNLQVAQSSASAYAISARGMNNNVANKLLVMIDGRSVYTPLYSGVFWDVQDVVLEDVERVEVISGPGGTLWGANAVNGVINIITRSAKSSQGGLIAVGAGNRESGNTVRYGGSLGTEGGYRVYAKYFDRRATETLSGSSKADGWYKSQVGFRADWEQPMDNVMLQGNAYDGSEAQLNASAVPVSGFNLTGRWEHTLSANSSLSVQAYFDRTERTIPLVFGEHLDIVDLQIQHSLVLAGTHTVSWGLGYRLAEDRVSNTPAFAFLPANVDQHWSSIFMQDEVGLTHNLQLTLGARVERNDYTGNEWLPNARLAWKFAPEHLLWTAVSRTVRAPARLDVDTYVPAAPPFQLAGGPRFVSEVAKVVELGYRGQLSPSVSLSATAFRAEYDNLRTLELDPSSNLVTLGNGMQGIVQGVEMWGTYKASDTWRISAGLTAMSEDLQVKAGSTDTRSVNAQAGLDPRQRWMLKSSWDLSGRSELDCIVRSVSALANPDVPAYLALDLRYAWRPRPDLELSLTGRNLGGSHGEFASASTRAELGTAVFFKMIARF